jgi:hypothetical protein
MMPVAFGNRFEGDWYSEADGDGVLTFSASGKSFKAESSIQVDDGAGGTENRAYLRNFLQVRGGEKIIVRVLCRMISGEGVIAIDFPNRGNPKSNKVLNVAYHSHWMEHTVVAEVGEQAIQQDDSASIVVGSTLSVGGEMEVSRISVSIEGGANGAMRTHATGLIGITKAGGVVSYAVNEDIFNAGVLSVATNGTGLTITTPPVNDTEGLGRKFNPLVFTSIESPNRFGLVPYAGKFDATAGTFHVQPTNSSGVVDFTGAGLSDGETVSLSFEVRMA